jgi:predicted ArsR family transcriptional regulator
VGIEDLRRDLEDSYGDSLEVPEPGEWLKQSLGQLAKASVVRDAVQLGAAVRLLSPAAREQADNLVKHGLRLKDARRDAGRSADGYRAASDRFTDDSLTYNAAIRRPVAVAAQPAAAAA